MIGQLSRVTQGIAQAAVGPGNARPESQGLPISRDRLVKLPLIL